jgi:hypothetical protein
MPKIGLMGDVIYRSASMLETPEYTRFVQLIKPSCSGYTYLYGIVDGLSVRGPRLCGLVVFFSEQKNVFGNNFVNFPAISIRFGAY